MAVKDEWIWDISGTRRIKMSTIKEFHIVQRYSPEEFVVFAGLSKDQSVELKRFETLGEAQVWVNSR